MSGRADDAAVDERATAEPDDLGDLASRFGRDRIGVDVAAGAAQFADLASDHHRSIGRTHREDGVDVVEKIDQGAGIDHAGCSRTVVAGR
ncbi:MAG: hypothetical protein R2710_18650 [Acidimicrobiales bacterium]